MKRTQVMGGLLAAFAIALGSITGPGDLLAGKGGKGGGQQSAPPYSFKSLGTLGGTSSASGMTNPANPADVVVVGLSYDSSGVPRAFVWTPQDGIKDLNGFLPQGSGWELRSAADINDNGQIVGRGRYNGNLVGYWFDPSTQTIYDLGDVQPYAINASGSVVGNSNVTFNAFIWSEADGYHDLGYLGNLYTEGRGINDSGQLCGYTNSFNVAWRWTVNGGFEELPDLYGGRYAWTDGLAINNNGQVTGQAGTGLPAKVADHAFRYTDGVGTIDLGTLGGNLSGAGGINNLGDVVGNAQTAAGDWHMFLFTDALGMTDLQAAIIDLPADVQGSFLGIGDFNDIGLICGNVSGEAFLLVPSP